jgi:hypothetical protein
MKKQKTDHVSWNKAKELLKTGENFTIKIKQGTIFQSGGDRYFIDYKGNIKYFSDGKIRSVKV